MRVDRDRLLLSGEGISLLPADRLQSLKQYLAQHTRHIRVLAVVRHPLDFLESHVQAVVGAGNAMPVGQSIGQTKSKIIKLLEVFGDDVEFFSFQQAIDCPFGPPGYLLMHLGVGKADLDQMTFYARNKGISGEAVRLLTYVNAQDRSGLHPSAASNFHQADIEALKNLPGGKFRLYKNEFDTLRDQLQEEAGWINQTLGFGFEVGESLRRDFADDWSPETREELRKILSSRNCQSTREAVVGFLKQEAIRLHSLDDGKACLLEELANDCD